MTWRRHIPIAAIALAAAALTLFGVQAGTAVAAPCPYQGAAHASSTAQEKAMFCLGSRDC